MIKIIFIILIGNIIILTVVLWHMYKHLNKIIDTLNNFYNGNYRIHNYKFQIGMIGNINSTLDKLANKLYVEKNKLNEEKESTKSLVTDISHQIKTPLASIKLCNSILISEDMNKNEEKEFLLRIEQNVKRLEYLFEALINISRLEAGMINLKPFYIGIKETLINSINNVFIKAMEKEIEIEVNEFNDLYVYHDRKWTEEAIFNILDNAVKYSDKNTIIKINVTEGINYVRISIKDQGRGIEKEEYNKIFKRFYRGTNNNIEGSGVGLFLTRKILEEQGGSVSVKSKVNEGTEFIVLLKLGKCPLNDTYNNVRINESYL